MLTASACLSLPRLRDLPSSKAASRYCKQMANVEPGCVPVKKVLFVVTVSPEDAWEPKGDAGFYRGSTDAREASGRYGGAQHCRLFGFLLASCLNCWLQKFPNYTTCHGTLIHLMIPGSVQLYLAFKLLSPENFSSWPAALCHFEDQNLQSLH